MNRRDFQEKAIMLGGFLLVCLLLTISILCFKYGLTA